jgi:hypothetical protein
MILNVINKSFIIKTWIISTIVLGIILPIVNVMAIKIKLAHIDAVAAFKFAMNFFCEDIGMFLIWLWQDIPFIFLALLIRSCVYRKLKNDSLFFIQIFLGWAIAFLLSVIVYIDPILRSKESAFSLTSLPFIIIPFWIIISILLGYGFGGLIVKLIHLFKKNDAK